MYQFEFRLYTTVFITACVFFYGTSAQNVNATDDSEISSSSSVSVSTEFIATTTVKPPKNISCDVHNGDCNACVALSECYYCDDDKKCKFHITNIADGECNINSVHYFSCRINLKVMMIMVGVMIGIALLIILITCCYCCCKKRGVKLSKDDLKWARQREERKQIAAEKRKERAERTEEIRKKYGLVKDSNPYQRFDA